VPYILLAFSVSFWVLVVPVLMMVVAGLLLMVYAAREEVRYRRREKEPVPVALLERAMKVAARQPLWKFEGGGKLRACPECAGKLGLIPLRTDGGKRRTVWGCEICSRV